MSAPLTKAQEDEIRVAQAILLVDKIGPLLNGHDTGALISALSALLGTVIRRHSESTGITHRRLVDVMCRHALTLADKMAVDEASAVRH